MKRKALVTGGAGFIGSHLVDRLLANGEDVVVLDNLSSGNRDNLSPEARFVEDDILNESVVAELVSEADSVFHLAALVSVQACIDEWDFGHKVNCTGAMQLFRIVANAGRERPRPLVYASSAAIYGDRSGSTCSEGDLPNPISPYGADKLACEHQARTMAVIHGLRSVGLRFFNVYGPRQDPRSPYAGVISKFCANRAADSAHTIFGDGAQSRDFIYVDDVVDGLLKARAFAAAQSDASVFNLCTGHETTLMDLVTAVDDVADRGESVVRHAEARAGDIRMSLGNAELAREALHFDARTGIRQGLTRLWESIGPDSRGR